MSEPPAPAEAETGELAEPIDAPQDLKGCLVSMFRCGGCMAILYIIMFFAILSAAALSLLFFR